MIQQDWGLLTTLDKTRTKPANIVIKLANLHFAIIEKLTENNISHTIADNMTKQNKKKPRKNLITLIYHHYWKGFFFHLAPTKKGAATCPNDSFGKKHKVAIYQGNKFELAIFRSWYVVGFEKNSTFLSDL